MTVSGISGTLPFVPPQAADATAKPVSQPKPAAQPTPPTSRAPDSDGDHDGSVGTLVDVKA